MTIKIAVTGALGKMGQEVVKAVIADSDCELVCAIDKFNLGFNVHGDVAIEGDIKKAFELKKPDVVIDFTQPDIIFENIKTYLDLGVKSVIGTTGLSSEQLSQIEKLTKEKNTGCFIAPNFSTGAVLMMKFAQLAAKYFNNAEIIEFHHNQKKDAPSGTAIKTAELMAQENSNFKDCAKLMKKGMRDAKVCGLLVAAAGVLAAGTFAIVKAFKNDSDKVDNKPKTISEKPKEIKQDTAAMQPVKNN